MTSELFKGLLVGGMMMVLVGCGGGEEPAQPTTTTTPPPTDTAQPEQPAEQPADPVEEAPAGNTQETPEGTMALFLEAMKEGDYDTVLALSDETSVGYGKLEEFSSQLATTSENAQQAEALAMVRTFMVKPWENVDSEAVTIRDERAKFMLTFANAKTLEMNLVKSEDGLWMMFLPERFLEAGIDSTSGPSGQAG